MRTYSALFLWVDKGKKIGNNDNENCTLKILEDLLSMKILKAENPCGTGFSVEGGGATAR